MKKALVFIATLVLVLYHATLDYDWTCEIIEENDSGVTLFCEDTSTPEHFGGPQLFFNVQEGTSVGQYSIQ